MNTRFPRLYHDEGGQVLYLIAALLVVILGMAALSIDIGFALHGQRELQASADAVRRVRPGAARHEGDGLGLAPRRSVA